MSELVPEGSRFDLDAYEDDLAVMRAEQDAIDAEAFEPRSALAEALCLLTLCDRVRAARFEAVKRAEAKLGNALEALFRARDDLDSASEVEIQAMETVTILRGGIPGHLRSAISQIEVQL